MFCKLCDMWLLCCEINVTMYFVLNILYVFKVWDISYGNNLMAIMCLGKVYIMAFMWNVIVWSLVNDEISKLFSL